MTVKEFRYLHTSRRETGLRWNWVTGRWIVLFVSSSRCKSEVIQLMMTVMMMILHAQMKMKEKPVNLALCWHSQRFHVRPCLIEYGVLVCLSRTWWLGWTDCRERWEIRQGAEWAALNRAGVREKEDISLGLVTMEERLGSLPAGLMVLSRNVCDSRPGWGPALGCSFCKVEQRGKETCSASWTVAQYAYF